MHQFSKRPKETSWNYTLSSQPFVTIQQIVKQMAYKHWENQVLVIHWHPLSPPAVASIFMTSTSLKVIHTKPSLASFWKSYQLGDEQSTGDIIHLGFIKVSLPNGTHSTSQWIFHSPSTACMTHTDFINSLSFLQKTFLLWLSKKTGLPSKPWRSAVLGLRTAVIMLWCLAWLSVLEICALAWVRTFLPLRCSWLFELLWLEQQSPPQPVPVFLSKLLAFSALHKPLILLP